MRGGGPQTPARALSGGNQQKVVVAREVENDPRVLIAAQPTRGLDVGAIEFVHRRLVEERDEGRAVLLVSLELDEILSLSDRILVMYEGEIVGEYGAGRDRGGARRRDARRDARGGGGRVSDRAASPTVQPARAARPGRRRREAPPTASRTGTGRAASSRPSSRRSSRSSSGGLVVLATGSQPDRGLQGNLERDRPRVVLPASARTRSGSRSPTRRSGSRGITASRAAENLQQTLILTSTLILTGLAVAFAFRCGLFNIGGQGQYFVGAYFAIWIGSSLRGHEQLRCTSRSRSSPPRSQARRGRGSRGS